MKLTGYLTLLTAAACSLVSAVTIPGADTPLFYLIATGPDTAGVNFLPVRLNGGSNYFSILTGTGPIAKFYFKQGQLVAVDPVSGPSGQAYRALVNTQQSGTGTCATFGQFGTVFGSSSNKCASYSTFGLQSNSENSQLGAHIVFNWTGGFYVCGAQKEVYYKVNPADGPAGCTQIELYTLPVIQ
ncbi:hypothetical protein DFP72DRAFT_921571 [Ephemerocybe angulata]|uniref:Uncharacterized protein n=1 Tax=Ephemerocybe angulata TaxID=980116 RepID=A0A8H6HH59_9AGAR|nr:hypothetical protein DFP72DRAFT_921571 [Tulosesus angulatus]